MKSFDGNLEVYNKPNVVAFYANYNRLTACEAYVFDKYVESGGVILDIGVGGGRTTPYLSDRAAKYIGVDYSRSMIEVCRSKFPALEFHTENASDLRRFENAIFDVVVFSFNGIDYIRTDEARIACFREIFRVLKPGGRFIFSSHNAKLLGYWPIPRDASLLQVLRSLRSLYHSIRINVQGRGWGSQAFNKGTGYVFDPELGGLVTFVSTPEFVTKEASITGFTVAEVVGNMYPSRVPAYFTVWYYYVLVKP